MDFRGRIMEILRPEFWSGQVAVAMQAWAIFIPLLITFVFAAWKIKSAVDDGEIRALNAHKGFLEAQLERLGDHNLLEAKTIANMQSELGKLRKLVEARAQPSALEPIIKTAETIAVALATANSTTHRIINTIGHAHGIGKARAASTLPGST